MSCKACGKQLQGAQFDLGLCGTCAEVSNYYLEIAKTQNEEQTGGRKATPSAQRFADFVEKHDLVASWADGLGLMSPEARAVRMRDKTWEYYCEYLDWGLGHERALQKATGLSRKGNQRFALAGMQSGHNDGNDEGGGNSISPDEAFFTNEKQSYDNLWQDDL